MISDDINMHDALNVLNEGSVGRILAFLVVVNSPAPETAQRSTSMNTNRILRKKRFFI